MQKINLLYVITKLELGGAQKQLLELIRHSNRERYNTFLFTARDGLLIEEVKSIDGLRLKRSEFLERPINPLKDILALIEIYRFIRKNNIKIVHTHSSKAGILGRWAARLANTKIILHTVHGWSFHDYQSRLIQILFILLERITAKFTTKLIVVSDHDRKKGLRNQIGKEDKYVLIRYGLNFTEFSIEDQSLRKELGIDSNDLLVGMISCLKPQKSPQDFIKLAHLIKYVLPDTKFLLVGDGILRRKVEGLISKFNLQRQVILVGWCWNIPKVLSAIDILVLTSLWEGLPICALEAMAASKPVVATSTGGIAEVITEGKTGFLVSPRNTQRMSERLILLLREESLRRQIGLNAKDSLSSDFSLKNMVKNNQDLYDDLIKEEKHVN